MLAAVRPFIVCSAIKLSLDLRALSLAVLGCSRCQLPTPSFCCIIGNRGKRSTGLLKVKPGTLRVVFILTMSRPWAGRWGTPNQLNCKKQKAKMDQETNPSQCSPRYKDSMHPEDRREKGWVHYFLLCKEDVLRKM